MLRYGFEPRRDRKPISARTEPRSFDKRRRPPFRHADVLLVTGPVTLNMREALERTYAATPAPKWVVACGACAADGGVFAGSYAIAGGASSVVPVDLVIPGCPPSPAALLKGLLALMEGPTGQITRPHDWPDLTGARVSLALARSASVWKQAR